MCPPVIMIGMMAVSAAFSMMATRAAAKGKTQQIDFQVQQKIKAEALEGVDRKAQLKRSVAQKRNLLGATGVELEGTAPDIFAETAGGFAREQFASDFQTAGEVTALQMEKANVKSAARNKQIGTALSFASKAASAGAGGFGGGAGAGTQAPNVRLGKGVSPSDAAGTPF